LIYKSDLELSKILGVSRVTITRWRNCSRYPKFNEIIKYEKTLKFPFECFLDRNPNLIEIKEKLELQLKVIKKAIETKKTSKTKMEIL
jgi:transcriptional regulator with XRE-family HTH domain